MRIFKILFYITGIFFTTFLYGQGGKVETISFESTALGEMRSFQIYLPYGYNSDSSHYPVIYFLHGATSNHEGYTGLYGLLNNLITAGDIKPVIMVKPDGSAEPWGGSMYVNSTLYGKFEDYITEDLVEYIDTHYRTIANRQTRSIMGHSMGGYGAMYLSFRHPDLYCAAASHSGPLDLSRWDTWKDSIFYENGGMPPYDYIPDLQNRMFTYLIFTAAGAFSPNLLNTPYMVDLPIDSLGNNVDTVIAKWNSYNPAHLASEIAPGPIPDIYFDCGNHDELLFNLFNQSFADSLDNQGIPCSYYSYEGGHSDNIGPRFIVSINHLDSVMNSVPVGINGLENKSGPVDYVLLQNYPNPFNPATTIKYQLPLASYVQISVYNILGEKVATLVNSRQQAGRHTVSFLSSKMSSGLYFYRLNINGRIVDTKKMVLLK